MISPSFSWMIRLAYWSARSGLCVTIMTSLSFAIFDNKSMTCSLVALSSAPVGSSASTISGSFINARAIATLCICPPLNWFGNLRTWSSSPTSLNASSARFFRSERDTPLKVKANSTLANTVWCGIKL